jgi:hypothetical protein
VTLPSRPAPGAWYVAVGAITGALWSSWGEDTKVTGWTTPAFGIAMFKVRCRKA